MVAKRKTVRKVGKADKRKVAKRAKEPMAKAKSAVAMVKKVSEPFTKTLLINTLSDRADVSKKQVSMVLDELSNIIGAHVAKGSAEEFKLPGLFKIKVKRTPARKARKGTNPFTGEPTTFKAKPAGRKVRILPLKKLKEMAQ